MSQNASLIATIDKILVKTESGIASELDKILQDATSSLEESKGAMEAEYASIIDGAKKEGEKIEKQIIGSSNLESRNRQISLVEEAISAVFGQAVKKLRSVPADPTLLKSLIGEATRTLGSTKVSVSANSRDADAVKSILADFEGASLDSKPIDCLGGIIARSSDGNMSFDNTLDSRLDRLKPLIRKDIAAKFGLD